MRSLQQALETTFAVLWALLIWHVATTHHGKDAVAALLLILLTVLVWIVAVYVAVDRAKEAAAQRAAGSEDERSEA